MSDMLKKALERVVIDYIKVYFFNKFSKRSHIFLTFVCKSEEETGAAVEQPVSNMIC
jgi:hypothetical protein